MDWALDWLKALSTKCHLPFTLNEKLLQNDWPQDQILKTTTKINQGFMQEASAAAEGSAGSRPSASA